MKKKFLYVMIVTLMMGVSCALAGAQVKMTLTDCLNHGFENNPTLRAAAYGVAAADKARKSRRADFFPTLSARYSLTNLTSLSARGLAETDYLDQKARDFSLRLSQVLYAGSRIINTYNIAVIEKEKREADRALAQLELAYNIKVVFFQLMGAEQDVKVALRSVKNLEEGVNSAKAHFNRELVSWAEVLTTKVDLDDAQQKLSIAKNDVNRKRIALFSLMNMPVSEDVKFYGGLDFFPDKHELSFERCWEIAVKNRPDLENLALQLSVLEKEADIALGSYLPIIRLELAYHDRDRDFDSMGSSRSGTFDRDQRNRYWSAGLVASWDFFDGGRAWYQKQQSNIKAKQTLEMIKATRLSIKEGIRKALFSIAEADRRISGSRVAVKAAQENYNAEKRRLDAGLTTIPLLLDAQIRLTRAERNYTQAILAYMLGRAELEFMKGENYKTIKK